MTEPMREYEVTVNGLVTTMQLTEADAKAYGDAAKPTGDSGATEQQATGQTKAATPENK